MRHGRFMGYGYNGSIILFIILFLMVIVFIVFISDSFRKRSKCSNQKYLDILNERYAQNEINSDEYREISMSHQKGLEAAVAAAAAAVGVRRT